MGAIFVFGFGVLVGVIYEKQIRRYKLKIEAAAKAAHAELGRK